MKKSRLLGALFVIAINSPIFTSSSFASTIAIYMEGKVTQVDPIFSSLVSLGDPMVASFIYDPSLITRSIEFGADRYFYYSPLVEYEVSMGSVYAHGTGGRSEVSNNHIDQYDRLWDRFILQNGGVSYPFIPSLENLFDINALAVGMTLYDYVDADALTTSQPLENIPLESFDLSQSYVTIQMEVVGGDFDWQPMFARITSAEIVLLPEVPIPASAWLFGGGLLGLIGIARRKAA